MAGIVYAPRGKLQNHTKEAAQYIKHKLVFGEQRQRVERKTILHLDVQSRPLIGTTSNVFHTGTAASSSICSIELAFILWKSDILFT